MRENDEELDRLRKQKEELENDFKETQAEKATEIKNLEKSIEMMSSEFSTMLKSTLEKMKERIEAANKAWEDENEKKILNQAKD